MPLTSPTPILDGLRPAPRPTRPGRWLVGLVQLPFFVSYVVVGDFSERFDAFVTAMAPGGVAAVAIVVWLGLVFGSFAATAIHETGHLLAGLAVRYRFVRWSVGPIAVAATSEGLRLRANPERHSRTSMQPRAGTADRGARIVFLSGGIVANLATAFAALAAPVAPRDPLASAVCAAFWLLGFVSIGMGVGNLVPLRRRPLPMDGAQIVDAWAAGARSRRTQALVAIRRELARGTEPAKLDRVAIETILEPDDGAADAMRARAIAYAAFAESDLDRAAGYLEAALRASSSGTEDDCRGLALEAATYFGWFRGDAAGCARWAAILRRAPMPRETSVRLEIVEAWVRGDVAEADRLVVAALAALDPKADATRLRRLALLRWRVRMLSARRATDGEPVAPEAPAEVEDEANSLG